MGDWGDFNLRGLIPILGGFYGYLLAIGVLPRNPKEPEKVELWQRKFGKPMKILGPFLVIYGLLEFFRVL